MLLVFFSQQTQSLLSDVVLAPAEVAAKENIWSASVPDHVLVIEMKYILHYITLTNKSKWTGPHM